MKFIMLIKDINTKTLVSGDKQTRVVLESLYPADIKNLAKLSDILEVEVTFKYGKEEEK